MINKRNKGISLITLVITIVVVIILAAVAILSIGKNNVDAKEASFKQSMKSYDEQIDVAMQTAFIDDQNILNKVISGKQEISQYSRELAESKYIEWVYIKNGKLTLSRNSGFTEEQIEWAIEIGINVEGTITSEEGISYVITKNGVQFDGYTNDKLILNLSYPNISGDYIIQYKKIDDEEWTDGSQVEITEENVTILARIFSADYGHATADTTIDVTTVDLTPPSPPSLEVIQDVNSVKVIASGSTDGISGVAGYKYSNVEITQKSDWDNIELLEADEEYIIEDLKSGEEVTVYVVSVDNANNISAVTKKDTSSTLVEGELTLDFYRDYTRGPIKVVVTYDGVLPDGYVIENVTETGEPFDNITKNTFIYSRVYNESLDDEITSISDDITNIDNSAPTAPTDINVTREQNSLTVHAEGSKEENDGDSGVYGYQYSIDGMNWSNVIEAGSQHTIDSLNANTNYTVYARAIDLLDYRELNAGNITVPVKPSASYDVDTSTLSTYNVIYNSNTTDTVSNLPVAQTKVEGKTLTLSNNTPTRTGYTFGGWATSASGTKVYDKGGSYTGNGGITLYAIWTPITYSIKYNVNGGSGTMANTSHTYDVAANLRANAFTRTGYTFAGWATSATGAVAHANSASVKNLTTTSGGTVNLFAKWTPITYSVKYNANGGSGTMANTSHTYDVAANLRANTFTRTGYTFAGWATSASGAVAHANSASVKNLTTTSGGTVNLFAKWTPITYTVSYNANGGSGTMANTSHTYDVAANLRANVFTRAGYSFAGWATSASGAVVYANSASVKNLRTTSGTITLYAVWREKITITFSGTNGSLTNNQVKCLTGGNNSAGLNATIPAGCTVYYKFSSSYSTSGGTGPCSDDSCYDGSYASTNIALDGITVASRTKSGGTYTGAESGSFVTTKQSKMSLNISCSVYSCKCGAYVPTGTIIIEKIVLNSTGETLTLAVQ